jgi:hypothetical protein
MGFVKLKRGISRFWALLYRSGLARPRMPFWRVVVEGKLDRRVRKWPRKFDVAVTAVYVWAGAIEEAEGLAALALEAEGLITLTADAVKCPPAAAPKRQAMAVARSAFGFLARPEGETGADGPSRRGARA